MNVKYLALVSSIVITGVITGFSTVLPQSAASQTVPDRTIASELTQIKPMIQKRENSVVLVTTRPNLSEKPAIAMPGTVIENTATAQRSYSNATTTAYFIIEAKTSPRLQALSDTNVQTLLIAVLPDVFKHEGTISQSEPITRDGYPGVRFQINLNNGLTGIYQMFVAGDRFYTQGAITAGQFSSESEAFLNSIQFRSDQHTALRIAN